MQLSRIANSSLSTYISVTLFLLKNRFTFMIFSTERLKNNVRNGQKKTLRWDSDRFLSINWTKLITI